MIIQCKCDCGTEFEEYDKKGRKREYVKGHCRRGKTHSPETKQLMSINHADFKGEKHHNYGKHPSDATRQLMSKNRKGKPTWNKGLKGVQIPWNKGQGKSISSQGYSKEFNAVLKQFVREKSGFTCEMCGKKEYELSEHLSIHHLDYNKINNNIWNLIPICRKCHSITNSRSWRTGWCKFTVKSYFRWIQWKQIHSSIEKEQ